MAKNAAKNVEADSQPDSIALGTIVAMPPPPVAEALSSGVQVTHDREVLHASLSRLARLLGYTDTAMPDHANDIDTAGVSARLKPLVEWAKTVRLP